MRKNSARQGYELERRALVGFACALVLLQALLATLAWPLPRAQADAAFAICHAGAASPDSGVPEPAGAKPNLLCALCAHAIGAALPPGTTAVLPAGGAVAAIQHGALTPIRLSALPVRAGAARAPPAVV